MSVTLLEVMAAAQARRSSLVGETIGYLVLAVADQVVDAPRHVVLIPLEVLKKEAQRNGLESAWTTTDDVGARGWNRFGWEYSLANFAVGRRPKKWLRRLGRGLSAALQPWDRREGKGSAYTAVFRNAR